MQCCARPKRGARGGGAAKAEPPPPLLFETVDSELILSEDRTTVTRDAPKSPTTLKKGRKLGGGGKPGGGVGRYKLAACDNPSDLMATGVHCVEFTLAQASGNVTLGVMQEDYDPKQPIAPGEARGDGAESWGLSTRSGSLSFRGKATMWKGRQPIPEGSVVGMRVDFKKGNITIFLNGDHLGDMVKAGVKGPLCWMCELSSPGDCVTVNRREKLP